MARQTAFRMLSEVLARSKPCWGQDEDRLLAREASFDAHLVKPADTAEIERLLNSASITGR